MLGHDLLLALSSRALALDLPFIVGKEVPSIAGNVDDLALLEPVLARLGRVWVWVGEDCPPWSSLHVGRSVDSSVDSYGRVEID